MSQPSAKLPILLSFVFVVAGLIIGTVSGLSTGSLVGGGIAAAGIIPALWGAWAGMQKETQASLGLSLLVAFVSLGVGGLLIVLRVVHWFR